MTDDLQARADARLEDALADATLLDPRPHYRKALRHLKDRDPAAFEEALRYFREELVPAAAREDPLEAWSAYGRFLARSMGPGRTVTLDATGRARPDADPGQGLVLHIPDDDGVPVLVLRYPRSASPAQRAAYELLVEGRQTASAYG
jgi:hypothetical protein